MAFSKQAPATTAQSSSQHWRPPSPEDANHVTLIRKVLAFALAFQQRIFDFAALCSEDVTL
jgi:hypothetical protein